MGEGRHAKHLLRKSSACTSVVRRAAQVGSEASKCTSSRACFQSSSSCTGACFQSSSSYTAEARSQTPAGTKSTTRRFGSRQSSTPTANFDRWTANPSNLDTGRDTRSCDNESTRKHSSRKPHSNSNGPQALQWTMSWTQRTGQWTGHPTSPNHGSTTASLLPTSCCGDWHRCCSISGAGWRCVAKWTSQAPTEAERSQAWTSRTVTSYRRPNCRATTRRAAASATTTTTAASPASTAA